MSRSNSPSSVRSDRGPVSAERVEALDVARAFSVFGMIVVNYAILLAPSGVEADPGGLAGLLTGRAAATFVVLAGAGMALLAGQNRTTLPEEGPARARRVLLGRALALFFGGHVLLLVWPADILHFYGAYLALGAAALRLRNRTLLGAGAALAFVFLLLLGTFDWTAGWDFKTLEYQGVWTPDGWFRHYFFNGFHPVIPWFAFALFGVWLGRRVRDPGIGVRLALWGAAGIAAVELISGVLVDAVSGSLSAGGYGGDLLAEDVEALFGTAPFPPVPLYMLGGVASACLAIGISFPIVRHAPRRLATVLIRIGKLALTIYVAHAVLGVAVLGVLESTGGPPPGFAGWATLVFLVLTVGVAAWIGERRGPLERLLRGVSRVGSKIG